MLREVPTPSTALLLGRGLSAAVTRLGAAKATITRVTVAEVAGLQLEHRYDMVIVRADLHTDAGRHRSTIHCAVQHLEREGHLAVRHDAGTEPLCEGFRADDLRLVGQCPVAASLLSVFQRGPRTTVHDLLFEARASIARVTPHQLSEQMRRSEPPLVIDTRTHTDRNRFGVVPGSVHVPRTVVEWHLDPANGYLHPAMTSFEQPIVVVCNGGYSSSLAAANLARIGFTSVADLIGGHSAWCAAGLPVELPDHSHLDIPAFEQGAVSPAR